MWPYWLMFLLPAWMALMSGRFKAAQARVMWLYVGAVFALMMGLRHEVGGDWMNYLPMFDDTSDLTLAEALSRDDPGYHGVSWLVSHAGGDIYVLNLLCAIILMSGTVVFCKAQQRPWLALLVAVPYMLIVVGMGYTRQSVALGFALWGLTALGKGQVRNFVIWVAIGATFHKSAVLLVPIAGLAASRNRLLTAFLLALYTAMLYYLLLADETETLWRRYIEAQYESEGGLIRVTMNALPALVLILFRRSLTPIRREHRLWLWMAALAMVCLPLVIMSSTAVDRVALYLIPLQLFVFSRLPNLAKDVRGRTGLVLAIVAFYAAVQAVWLNFATHAFAWIPYQFMPFWD